MRAIVANGVRLHVDMRGPDGAPAVVFSNSLGTDLRLWDALLAHLPTGLRLVRYDTRGHGLSACAPGDWSIRDLAQDAAALIDALGLGPVVFVGLSMGGMIGQQLAADRPDLVRALVLSNTAARMGDAALWHDRIAAIRVNGLGVLAPAILDRWFGPAFRPRPEAALWGAMLTRTPPEGYLACCKAIAGADLTDSTARLRLPVLAIAGAKDGACPPAMVAATAALIPGAITQTLAGVGHLPCVEAPTAYATLLQPFLEIHTHA
jgi:3-oxoadipate enol-lactonase